MYANTHTGAHAYIPTYIHIRTEQAPLPEQINKQVDRVHAAYTKKEWPGCLTGFEGFVLGGPGSKPAAAQPKHDMAVNTPALVEWHSHIVCNAPSGHLDEAVTAKRRFRRRVIMLKMAKVFAQELVNAHLSGYSMLQSRATVRRCTS